MKPVKLTKEQLQQLIREARPKVHPSAPEVGPNPHDEMIEGVSAAFEDVLIRRTEDIAPDVFTMVTDLWSDEEMPLPVRYEDVEVFAKYVIDRLMAQDSEFKDTLQRQVESVIRRMMEPV